jgi:hypothetical protein
MRDKLFRILIVFTLTVSFPASGQSISSDDALLRTITVDDPVHFIGAESEDILLPAGDYFVIAADSNLQLIRLADGETFSLAATSGQHSEEVSGTIAVSVSGTGELSDSHDIALLSSDGTVLEAAGSYSGVYDRGLLNDAAAKAKEKARQAAIASQRKAAKAKADAQRAAQLAKQRANQAASVVASTATNVAENVGDRIDGAMDALEFREFVDGATQLGLQELLVCISNSRGQGKLPDLIDQARSNPGGLIRNASQELESKLTRDIPNRLNAALSRDATDAQIIDQAIARFEKIAKSKPRVACLMTYMEGNVGDWKKQVRNASNSMITSARAEAESLFNEKIVPVITGKIAEGLSDALEKKLDVDSESIVTGIFVGVLAEEMKASNKVFNQMLKQDIGARDSKKITAAIERTTAWPDSIILRFGYEIARAKAHDFVDEEEAPGGQWVNEQIITVYIAGMDGINDVVGALCGLIPEVGGIICAPFSYVSRFVYAKIVARFLRSKINEFMHAQVDVTFDKGWKFFEKNTNTNNAWKNAGPLGVVFQGYTRDTFIQMANDEVGPFREQLIEYNMLLGRIIEDYAASN